jgi:hypothetical protein
MKNIYQNKIQLIKYIQFSNNNKINKIINNLIILIARNIYSIKKIMFTVK